jgi:hypothetical protein
MIASNDWTSILNTKQVRLYGFQHRIKGFIEQRTDEISYPVAVVLCSLVVSELDLLQHMKITFHARSLESYVLGVGVYSAKFPLNHDTLHDGTDL